MKFLDKTQEFKDFIHFLKGLFGKILEPWGQMFKLLLGSEIYKAQIAPLDQPPSYLCEDSEVQIG